MPEETGRICTEYGELDELDSFEEDELAAFDEEMYLEYKAAMKKYVWQCLLMEGSKIILFFAFFAYFQLIPQFAAALFVLMLVRCNGGGLHCRHYISCLLLSFFVLAGCMYLGMQVPLPKMLSVAVLLICGLTGYAAGPVVSSNRPEPDEALVRQSKNRTAGIIFIYCFVICICPYSPYLNIGTWTIIIHILQLLLAKLRKRRDNRVQS